MQTVKKIKNCRVCKYTKFQKVLSFGPTALANAFLNKNTIDQPELFYPLDVYLCLQCNFLQLGHIVDPKILFKDYLYASSTSSVFVNHFKKFAEAISQKYLKSKNELIIDIGSNDGILLIPFKELGYRVLGIEPASTVAKIARKKGIETVEKFFSVALAKTIVKTKGKAKIITATNVFAHIDDLDEVIKGIKILLDDNGMFVIEAPYLVDFLNKKYFDLVYHEHLSYWSITTLQKLFQRHEMEIFNVEKVAVHGGSIRVYVKKKIASLPIDPSVAKYVSLEKKEKLFSTKTYVTYAKTIQKNKISGSETLDYVIDDSPLKQGLFTPGKHIPVVSSKMLYEKKPDYLLILAWNFADSIMQMHSKYKKSGGKFIVPVPKPKIIS